VAEAINADGGVEAVQLRVAEKYVEQFGHLAKSSNTLVLPATLSDVGSMIALAMNVLKGGKPGEAPRATSPAPRPGGAPPPMMPPR
jgi:hypothetical protein